MRRLLHLVPPGTLAVGGGLALLGLASYVHLAVAGHALDLADYSSLSVLWSIVFTLGIGVFIPVEQEVARVVAARRSQGLPPGPVLARGAAVATVVLALLVLATLAGRRALTDRLFAGDDTMVVVLIGALLAMAVAYTTRGVLSGLQLFPGTAPSSASTAGCASRWSPGSASAASPTRSGTARYWSSPPCCRCW